MLELAATLGVALVAVTVGVRLVDGALGLQAGLTVLVLAPELYLPVRQLAGQFHASADGLAVAERMLELIERAAGRKAPRHAARRRALWTRRCGWRRSPSRIPSRPGLVLDALDLELRPGETVALVGTERGRQDAPSPTCILGFAEPDSGRVTVGGHDLALCRTDVWRRHIAWVPQHPTIFRGTIADNIRLGRPGATELDLRDAAVLAGRRPLHPGAAPRLRDARRRRRPPAVGRRAPPHRDRPRLRAGRPRSSSSTSRRRTSTRTSAAVVAESVERLRSGRMVLLIAHRPELVEHVDRVVSLDGGSAAVRSEAP